MEIGSPFSLSEDMENISLCIFSILLSAVYY